MKKFRIYVSVLLPAAILVTMVACEQEVKEQQPLLLEEPPLLLDEKETEPAADNSRCHVCHINYEDEALAVTHARADISCEQCHGASDAHCGDEDNITPPDVMYPKEKIRPFCLGCHQKEKIDIAVHKSALTNTTANEGNCTNCHGEHRLSYRTRKWDKTTGRLIDDDNVRMLTDQKSEQQ